MGKKLLCRKWCPPEKEWGRDVGVGCRACCEIIQIGTSRSDSCELLDEVQNKIIDYRDARARRDWYSHTYILNAYTSVNE